MTDQTKFTVLVPTRERADTLYYALRTLTQQRYDNLSIVVSDNASTDRTEDVVRQASDSRISYVNTGARVSMSHNFEFALSHVQDGWVTFIGDDDGLLPGALERVNAVIRETGCAAITTGWCYFRWPGKESTTDRRTPPRMSVPLGDGYRVRNSRLWLKRLLDAQAQYPELPFLYTGGFASMDLVRKAFDQEGRFFRSRIPDVYSAVALASISESYVAMRAPVAVSGVSPHSTGHSMLSGSNGSPPTKFESEENLPIHPLLGSASPPWSMSLFIYESYLQAIHLHRDVLRVSMVDQLGQALAGHTGNGRNELEQYLTSVAERNGIDFGKVRNHVDWLTPNGRLRSYGTLVRRFLSRRIIPDAYGAQNVLDASWVANAAYRETTEGCFWRAKELARRFQRD